MEEHWLKASGTRREEVDTAYGFDELVGKSIGLKRLLAQIEQVTKSDATVLIFGETGTGKELVAHAIHAHSRRKDQPLIAMNCAALPSSLIESELFGHEAEALTGALERRIGRVEPLLDVAEPFTHIAEARGLLI